MSLPALSLCCACVDVIKKNIFFLLVAQRAGPRTVCAYQIDIFLHSLSLHGVETSQMKQMKQKPMRKNFICWRGSAAIVSLEWNVNYACWQVVKVETCSPGRQM